MKPERPTASVSQQQLEHRLRLYGQLGEKPAQQHWYSTITITTTLTASLVTTTRTTALGKTITKLERHHW